MSPVTYFTQYYFLRPKGPISVLTLIPYFHNQYSNVTTYSAFAMVIPKSTGIINRADPPLCIKVPVTKVLPAIVHLPQSLYQDQCYEDMATMVKTFFLI